MICQRITLENGLEHHRMNGPDTVGNVPQKRFLVPVSVRDEMES